MNESIGIYLPSNTADYFLIDRDIGHYGCSIRAFFYLTSSGVNHIMNQKKSGDESCNRLQSGG